MKVCSIAESYIRSSDRCMGGRFVIPFAVDFGIAGSMISQLAADTHRGQGSALLCPIVDAAVAGIPIAQSHLDIRHVHHDGVDLSTVLASAGRRDL